MDIKALDKALLEIVKKREELSKDRLQQSEVR